MLKFYGYKRCSTSKKAQKWLDDHQVVYQYQDLVEKHLSNKIYLNG